MATKNQHSLFLDLQLENIPIINRDVVFILYRGKGKKEKKFGELRISQGALVWRGAFDQYGRKISWNKLQDFMEENGQRAEIRPRGEKKTVPRSKRTRG